MASRLRKRLERSILVSWREQPNRYDIEALQDNVRRVGLVIRVRWSLIIVLVLYSLLGGLLYATRMPVGELARLMAIPALTLGFVVLYNTFYALNYRRLGNIAVWNNLQLLLDGLVVTVLVYFSGGASSWFWTMYALFILEAAFILPRSRDAWMLAFACVLLLGAIEWLMFFGVLPLVEIPFATAAINQDAIYVAVRYLWQVAVLIGAAWVSTALVGEFREELAARGGQRIVDSSTGLYSRGYYLRVAAAEVRRSIRDQQPVHIVLLDIDHFNDFNERFGFDAGDRMLTELARAITDTVAPSGDVLGTTNFAARFGGEEFVVLLAEEPETASPPSASDARHFAEALCRAVSAVRVEGAGVTASIGVASSPDDGTTLDGLLDAADEALACAAQSGGNRVVAARDCQPSDDLVDAAVLQQDA